MPIRFRCVYCDKLLGIATRKAGSVVNCPQCGQPLIVPTPAADEAPDPEPPPAPARAPTRAAVQPTPAPAPTNPGKLFEQDDFDVLLEPEAPTFRGPDAPPMPPLSRSDRIPSTLPMPPQAMPVDRRLPPAPTHYPTPVALPNQRSGGLVLSSGMLIFAIILAIVLMGLSFGGGFLVARMMNQG